MPRLRILDHQSSCRLPRQASVDVVLAAKRKPPKRPRRLFSKHPASLQLHSLVTRSTRRPSLSPTQPKQRP